MERKRVTEGFTPEVHNESTYTNWGCRCPVCRTAHAARQRAARLSRAERLKGNPSLAVHGKSATYSNWRCRCEACINAWRVEQRKQRARILVD